MYFRLLASVLALTLSATAAQAEEPGFMDKVKDAVLGAPGERTPKFVSTKNAEDDGSVPACDADVVKEALRGLTLFESIDLNNITQLGFHGALKSSRDKPYPPETTDPVKDRESRRYLVRQCKTFGILGNWSSPVYPKKGDTVPVCYGVTAGGALVGNVSVPPSLFLKQNKCPGEVMDPVPSEEVTAENACMPDAATAKALTDKGDADAFYALGHLYDETTAPKEDPTKCHKIAASWYKKAADAGHARAQYTLGVLYETGDAGEKNYVEAGRLLTAAACAGHIAAQSRLGAIYMRDGIFSQNYEKAFYWSDLAARKGDSNAKETIGWLMDPYGGNIRKGNPALTHKTMCASSTSAKAKTKKK